MHITKRYALRKPPFESERLFDLLKNISLSSKRYLSILLIQGAFFVPKWKGGNLLMGGRGQYVNRGGDSWFNCYHRRWNCI